MSGVSPGYSRKSALVVVGIFMLQGLARVDMSDLANAVPVVLMLLVTVLSNNLIKGMAIGTFAYILLCLALGRRSGLTPVVWGLGAIFVLFFVVTSRLM